MDLLSPRPFWPIRDGLPANFPPLREDASCDVAVIGGGICGAFVTTLLTESGHKVVVLDRREVAHGSTAGNTGLMLYEIDVMLHRLSRQIGQDRAERAYRRCRDAIEGVAGMVRKSKIDCGFVRKSSLFVAASPRHVPSLKREFAARRAAGLELEWRTRREIRATSSLPHEAALLSPGAAQLDAYRLTYGLMAAAEQAGARIYDRTAVTRWKFHRTGVDLFTSRGKRVRARRIVVATGYEAESFLPRRVGSLHSTFALVSEPLGKDGFAGWPRNHPLIWDTGDPYLYFRTTEDHRAMVGGYDEPFASPSARDRMLRAKTSALARRFRQFFPRIEFEIATAWAGTFGVTDDGLPFIGRYPGIPHTWFALGFGGNGTTFSLIAAEIIRGALAGDPDPDAELFGFER